MRTKTSALAVLATLILAFVAAPSALAQKGSFELSLGAGLTTLDDKLGGDTGGSLDFRVGYFVNDRLEIELQSAHATSIVDGSFSAHTLNAVYHFEAEGDFLPYVLVGAGIADVREDTPLFAASPEDEGTALRAAFGGRFDIRQTGGAFSSVEISALNEDSFDEDATHIAISVLFGWNFES